MKVVHRIDLVKIEIVACLSSTKLEYFIEDILHEEKSRTYIEMVFFTQGKTAISSSHMTILLVDIYLVTPFRQNHSCSKPAGASTDDGNFLFHGAIIEVFYRSRTLLVYFMSIMNTYSRELLYFASFFPCKQNHAPRIKSNNNYYLIWFLPLLEKTHQR